jgi:hypothetical protein
LPRVGPWTTAGGGEAEDGITPLWHTEPPRLLRAAQAPEVPIQHLHNLAQLLQLLVGEHVGEMSTNRRRMRCGSAQVRGAPLLGQADLPAAAVTGVRGVAHQPSPLHPGQVLAPDMVAGGLQGFRLDLSAAENEIIQRNRRRPHAYEYLRPSLIPNSTNIWTSNPRLRRRGRRARPRTTDHQRPLSACRGRREPAPRRTLTTSPHAQHYTSAHQPGSSTS